MACQYREQDENSWSSRLTNLRECVQRSRVRHILEMTEQIKNALRINAFHYRENKDLVIVDLNT